MALRDARRLRPPTVAAGAGAAGAAGASGEENIERNELFFLELAEFVAGTAGAEEFIYSGKLFYATLGF